jgi:hypothetical protein
MPTIAFWHCNSPKISQKFFMRPQGHCAAHKANNDQHLTLLRSSITDNEIRRCIENNIAYRMSYNKIHISCLREFGKPVDYWFLEEMDLTIKNNNVVNIVRRLFTIVGARTIKPLNRDNETCPWSIAMCKRLFMELSRPVAKEVMKIWRSKNGMKLFKTAELAQTDLNKYSPCDSAPQ